MFERHFVAYGVRIALRVDSRALLDTLEQDPARMHLPFGWCAVEDHEPDAPVAVSYELLTGASGGESYRVHAGTNLVADVRGLTDAGRAVAAHAEPFVAERAPDHLFVHAGVVGWEGRAIVMPGASFAGKTTLVQAWLEAGATYYSDEFAVLDRAGRVHPFARPLAIRDGSTALTAACRSRHWAPRLERRPAHRTRPGDLVPGRRPLATAPLDTGHDAAALMRNTVRRAGDPAALDAHSEAGGE